MYFEKFPLTRYSLDGGLTTFLMTDIFRRVKADRADISNSLAYDEYDVRNGETPEILADKLYGDVNLHWILLVINEIVDPRFDWPMDETVLHNFIESKYGFNNMYSTHHYINNDGDIVHSSYALPKTAVTNFEYETSLNETKRKIVVLKPPYVSAFTKSFETAMAANGSVRV